VVEIIARAYYALKDTRTPVAIGTAAMLLNIVLSLVLAPLFTRGGLWPHGALALANTLATTLEMVVLVWIMRGRLRGLAAGRLWAGAWRSLAASAGMGAALALWLPATAGRSLWVVGLGGVVLGGAVYAVLAVVLRAPELALIRGRMKDDG
jgi:putative peptidoglycan lipid II flippase